MIPMRLQLYRVTKTLLPRASPPFRQQLRTISDWDRLVMASNETTAQSEADRDFAKKAKAKFNNKRSFDDGHDDWTKKSINDNNNTTTTTSTTTSNNNSSRFNSNRGLSNDNGFSNRPSNGNGFRNRPNNKSSDRSSNKHNMNNPNKKMKKVKPATEGSSEEVLAHDIRSLMESLKLEAEDSVPEGSEATENAAGEDPLPEPGTEIEVEVKKLSSTGDGLACQPGSKQIYVVPFSLPGDTIKVKVYRHLPKENHSVADFISVVKPGPLRDDSRVGCQYFTKCSGCQFQMMSYEDQLAHKRSIVERAFKNFSQLPPELVPTIQDTIGSPLQYGYRTKLTPHFDAPPGTVFRRGKPKVEKFFEKAPEIGFNEKGNRSVLDIEDCPIGTEAVRKGMAKERARMHSDYVKYSRGATILLRETTRRVPKQTNDGESLVRRTSPTPPAEEVVVEGEEYTDYKSYVTDNNAQSTEYVGDFVFANAAGSFFQNNNSILPPFTDYVRQRILPPSPPASSSSTATTTDATTHQKPIKYLIDAYSGSGLFTITQSSLFSGGSIGIDIDEKSINWARRNATLNKLNEAQCRFIAADAPKLFQSVEEFDPDETVVVLDPPRKGCDGSFLRQLLKFGPRRIVYVSCNVHTQARDVGIMVRGEVEGMGDEADQPRDDWNVPVFKNARYEIESIRGFDFFPQTGHVEGVAVLNRVVEA